MKHANGNPECPSCEQKLTQAHADLVAWYRTVKAAHPDCHISWSYRGKEDQEKAFSDRKSKLHFPMSAHNKSDDHGNPCSMALDLFRLDPGGQACWEWKYFNTIADECTQSGAAIFWGGHWEKLGDFDHFSAVEHQS